ncbi:MAG TPA: aspartyl protease family protein [Cyclobacteriaceae bacterium]|jgi:predicted aspartyl protease|nr:aspartyl protease family protein [Cyclobacteriaceae bacterium]
MRRLYALLTGFLIYTSAFGQLGFSLANGATKAEIPIEIHNNLVIVPVILNNQLPLKFIVDTGVRTTILTEKIYSDILRLAYSKKFTISAPGGLNTVNAYIANNVTIDMPGVHGRGHAMLVLENDFLELRSSLGSEVHGILGYELFSRFVIKIDYEAKLMTLMQPQKFKPSRKYTRLPITVEDTKPYYVAELKVNDTASMSAKLMIDTGASHGLFLDTESNDKLNVPPKNISCTIGKGLGGLISGRLARIRSLRIGRYTISNMIASFPDPNSYFDTLRTGRLVYRNGSIGGEVLSRFQVVFDFPREKIYLKPNHSFRKNSYYNMSGITVKATGASLREFIVVEVRGQSSAFKEGVKVGDRIFSINNTLTSEMDLSEINAYFNSRPGKKLMMKIIRDTEVIDKEILLINEI